MSFPLTVTSFLPNAMERDGSRLPRFVGLVIGTADISPEDQVCQNNGYDRMFGAIGLAVLSGLGRRSTHPARGVGFICPFEVMI